jgi:hypothetical protein
LVGLTYDQQQEVMAWHRHTTEDGDGIFESVAVVPYNGGTDDWDVPRDVTWVITNRIVGGVTKRYVEYFMPDVGDDIRHSHYVDCGLKLDDYANIISVTNTSPMVLHTATNVSWKAGYRVKIQDIGSTSTTQANNNTYTIMVATASTTYSIDADGTLMTTYVSGSGGVARRSVTSVSGLSHLEGKTVSVLVDGAVQANKTVVSGTVALSPEGCTVHVGLPYTSTLEILRPEGGSQDGTSQGKRKRIHDIMIRFYKTLGANVGSATDSMDIVSFRTPSDLMDNAPPLFSGDKIFPFEGGWDTNGYVRVTQDQPLPMTVLAISPRCEVND